MGLKNPQHVAALARGGCARSSSLPGQAATRCPAARTPLRVVTPACAGMPCSGIAARARGGPRALRLLLPAHPCNTLPGCRALARGNGYGRAQTGEGKRAQLGDKWAMGLGL